MHIRTVLLLGGAELSERLSMPPQHCHTNRMSPLLLLHAGVDRLVDSGHHRPSGSYGLHHHKSHAAITRLSKNNTLSGPAHHLIPPASAVDPSSLHPRMPHDNFLSFPLMLYTVVLIDTRLHFRHLTLAPSASRQSLIQSLIRLRVYSRHSWSSSFFASVLFSSRIMPTALHFWYMISKVRFDGEVFHLEDTTSRTFPLMHPHIYQLATTLTRSSSFGSPCFLADGWKIAWTSLVRRTVCSL